MDLLEKQSADIAAEIVQDAGGFISFSNFDTEYGRYRKRFKPALSFYLIGEFSPENSHRDGIMAVSLAALLSLVEVTPTGYRFLSRAEETVCRVC